MQEHEQSSRIISILLLPPPLLLRLLLIMISARVWVPGLCSGGCSLEPARGPGLLVSL